MKKISRAEARSQGLKRYFTGKSCKRGHVSERVTINGDCYVCLKLRLKQLHSLNPEPVRTRVAKWKREFPEKARAQGAKRKAAKLQRTPPWADLEAIKAFYEACPDGYHVDHHYPLQGVTASGLHVLENLRYLLPEVNSAKKNKMPEDFYGFTVSSNPS